MKKQILMGILLSCGLLSQAQKPIELEVWPAGAPENNGITADESIDERGILSNSKQAKLYVYLPEKEKKSRSAVVICPGGGYAILAMDHEGHDYAKWLAAQGITGIVLKYRMPNGHPNIPLSDAQEAMKIVRRNAEKWDIDPKKIGVSGFSAGGHLASTLGTHYDAESRPDFMLLFYPVISFTNLITHSGSRNNLLGKESNNEELINYFSNEKQINEKTPPTLLFANDDDTAVSVANSIGFYSQLKKYNVPAALYIFPNGGHGWGMYENFSYKPVWEQLFRMWLKEQKLIE